MVQACPASKLQENTVFKQKLVTATAATAFASPGRCDANLRKFEKCTFRKNQVYSATRASNRASYISEFWQFLARFLESISRFLSAIFDF